MTQANPVSIRVCRRASGTSALVVNHGTIAGLGAGAGGVDLRSGGKVVNGAPGNTGATITGPNGTW